MQESFTGTAQYFFVSEAPKSTEKGFTIFEKEGNEELFEKIITHSVLNFLISET